jgi:cystathionine gamma-synthase
VSKPNSTQAVHAGEEKHKPYGALTTPVVQSSTFTFRNTAEILEHMQAKADGKKPLRDEYGRFSNPTQRVAEHKIAALEGGERALLFASGMSAITTTMLSLLSSGSHLIMPREGFYITRDFAQVLLSRWGIETTFIPIGQPQALLSSIRPNTRLIFAEVPTNPTLRVMDLAQLIQVARQHGILTAVDSTIATPVNLRPLEYGVDLVIQSATKYLGGHNDLLAGAVIGSSRLLADIEKTRGILGGMSNPHDAYLLLRGLKTLALRVQRQNENGLQVASFLEGHPAVACVHYPGLSSHPDHAVALAQLSGYGGMVSFEIDGDFDKTARFIDLLRLPYIGMTLGGVESIIQQPAAHYSLEPIERKAAGMKDNLVRYSLGIENAEEIIADLSQALDKLLKE